MERLGLTFQSDSFLSTSSFPRLRDLHEAAFQTSVGSPKKRIKGFGLADLTCPRSLIGGNSTSKPGRKAKSSKRAYRRVSVLIITIMCERRIAHAEPMVHPEHAGTVADLMQSFDPNQTGDAVSSKMRHDVGRGLDEAEYARESLHQGVHEIDLLQRRFDTAEKIPLLLNLGVVSFILTLAAARSIWIRSHINSYRSQAEGNRSKAN